MSVVVLFDIDMTMIRTNRVGSGAMTETLRHMLGIEDGFSLVDFVGRTDRAILRETLARHGHGDADFEAFVTAFEGHYISVLPGMLRERGGTVLPGVRETLAALAGVSGTRLGLATGNFRRAAEIKLRHFDLWDHFLDGGFADDAEHRADLVAAAMRRMTAHCAVPPWGFVVVGDSVHDVTAAKANGATAVAVATGATAPDVLLAAGADLVLADLSDPVPLLQVVASHRA
jgi:phosphoglycolate phosphatase-like HAD superfamily hydrolase